MLIALNAFGMLTHYWFAFVLLAQFVTLVVFWRRGILRFLFICAASAVVFVAIWGKHFLVQLHGGATSWIPSLSAVVIVREFLDFYGAFPSVVLYLAAIGMLAIVVAHSNKHVLASVAVPAVLFVVTFVVPLLVSTMKPIFWPERYMIIAVVPLAVALAMLFTSALPRLAMALLSIVFLSYQVTAFVGERENAQSDRTTARFILDHAKAGDAVVFTSLTRASADYYFRRAHAEGRFFEISFPSEVASHLGWIDAITRTPERQAQLDKRPRPLRANYWKSRRAVERHGCMTAPYSLTRSCGAGWTRC